MLAILAPGQGAQRPGFLEPWLECPGAREALEVLSRSGGLDLVEAGTTMPEPDITNTAIAQPLIVAAGLMTAGLLPSLPRDTVYAGHSVGEFTAAALAGAVDQRDAMRLVATRGAAMARAAAEHPSGMTAVLGGDADDVIAAIDAAGCFVANYNTTGQVVAAGTVEALARFAADPPARARLRPLSVAGAFHTELMGSATAEIAACAASITSSAPKHALLSNADGTLVSNGPEIVSRLVAQVCRPVRWDQCLQTLGSMGVTAVIELAPGGTLTALVRRALPEINTIALNEPADLPAASALIAEHAAELTDVSPPWHLLVAPARGTVVRSDVLADTTLQAGQVVVRVVTRSDDLEVRTTHQGHLVEWLVHDGDPVNEGQPLVRLAAEAVA